MTKLRTALALGLSLVGAALAVGLLVVDQIQGAIAPRPVGE